MKLERYPAAIAGIERSILKLDQNIRRVQETLSTLTTEADRQVVFSTELKNEGQRKARKAELLATNPRYINAMTKINNLTDRRDSLRIDLCCYKNQFSVCKLRLRDAMAEGRS